ncbi:MAG: c-type cytochrome [Bryobacteraceae bacterium]|jgi:mono/diheme cytochrome c family protein
MHRAFCCLLLAALPGSSQVGSIAIYTQFQHEPPKAVLSAIQQEASVLMAPAGLRLQWKSLPSTGSDVSTAVAVVTFQGHCTAAELPTQPQWEARLGWSHVSDGEVLPFAGIDCDSILGFIDKRLFTVPPRQRDQVLGRAIGRVLAHEFDHIFAETRDHRARDMDQPEYSVEELVAPSLDSAAANRHILRPAAAESGVAKAGSAPAGASAFAGSGCSACHGAHGEGSRRGPVLHAAGRLLNTVMLATRLARAEQKMCQRAAALKLPPPSLEETEIQDVVSFLNQGYQ